MRYDQLDPKIRKKVNRRHRKINLVDGWDKPTSDDWAARLLVKGFVVSMFHYRGFYRRGNGGSFEAEVNLPKFIEKESVKRMVEAGIDILVIRKIRHSINHQYGDQNWKYQEAMRGIPRYRVFRSRNARTFSPLSMDVSYDQSHVPHPWIDTWTQEQIAKYIKKRARIAAQRYYRDLKKVYDRLVSEVWVDHALAVSQFDFNSKGEIVNMPNGAV